MELFFYHLIQRKGEKWEKIPLPIFDFDVFFNFIPIFQLSTMKNPSQNIDIV